MSRILISTFSVIKRTSLEWIDQDIHRLGAALAFYALFSIPPLFVVVLAMAGFWFGEEAARRELFGQVSDAVGSRGGDAIQSLMSVAHVENRSPWAGLVALTMLLMTSTGAFVELQSSLNTIWGVRRKPGRAIRNVLKDRLLSFAMIVGIGLLLLTALIFSEGLSALDKLMGGIVLTQEALWQVMNFVVSYGVLTLLIAIIFKTLPDVRLAWRNVLTGAVMTALLFNLGKLLFGQYLIRIDVTSAYGAASSLVIALLWIYYSAQILLFGAKFTQVYSDMNNTHVEPIPGAEAVTVEKVVSQHRPSHDHLSSTLPAND
ncbi:MAG: YihY/virulence factor BrkB family protein [Planctomycetaceae bacterium]